MRPPPALGSSPVIQLRLLVEAKDYGGGRPLACAAKYEQTWSEQPGDTTCADWHQRMDDHQRWVMAADMLYAARKSDGDDALPSDRLVDSSSSSGPLRWRSSR